MSQYPSRKPEAATRHTLPVAHGPGSNDASSETRLRTTEPPRGSKRPPATIAKTDAGGEPYADPPCTD